MGYERGGPLIVTPLVGAHIRAIIPQAAQVGKINNQTEAYVTPGQSWTVWAGDEIILCGGVMPIWPGRGYAWSILTERAGLHFLRLHRVVTAHLDALSIRRIEANTDAHFVQGHRWLRALGFEHEAHLTAWNPDGTDSSLYVRIR